MIKVILDSGENEELVCLGSRLTHIADIAKECRLQGERVLAGTIARFRSNVLEFGDKIYPLPYPTTMRLAPDPPDTVLPTSSRENLP